MSVLCCQSLSGVIICLLQAPQLRAPCVTNWVYNYTGRKEGGSGPAATYLITDNTPLDADHKATYDQPADFAETGFDKFQQTLLSALQAPMKTATTIEKNVLGNMRAAILQRSGSSRRKKNTRASQEDNVPLQINVSAADGLQEREVQV